jgi:hypothetical protein
MPRLSTFETDALARTLAQLNFINHAGSTDVVAGLGGYYNTAGGASFGIAPFD